MAIMSLPLVAQFSESLRRQISCHMEKLFEIFDLYTLADVLDRSALKNVVLQFSEDYLPHSVDIYLWLQSRLDNTNLYVVANSSWDRAIDDTAAMHVDGDVIVYFGSLIDPCSDFPIILMAPLRKADYRACLKSLGAAIDMHYDKAIILSEEGFRWLALRLYFAIENCSVAKLPIHADLYNWKVIGCNEAALLDRQHKVAGHIIDSEQVSPETIFIYVGDNSVGVDNLKLRFGHNTVIHIDPITEATNKLLGSGSHELMSRYGGVNKVKDAQTVGIILTTMGLKVDVLKSCLTRLQTLLSAAGKRYYTFIMGRLNEAKLCNFPEIDVFCIISSEDTSLIKPKTFPTPVVTPFEVEVGISARDWDATLVNSIDEIVATDIEESLRRVRSFRETHEEFNEEPIQEPQIQLISDSLVLRGTDSLTLFDSAAFEYFQSRNFKGLEESGEEDNEIRMGQFGIAASYVQIVDPGTKDIEDL